MQTAPAIWGHSLSSSTTCICFPSILLDGQAYTDGEGITPDDLYRAWWEKKLLPKTAAINVAQYDEHFRQWTEQGYDVIHISLGSALSSAHQNALLSARQLGHVYVIDSCSLSTGSGLIALQVADRIHEQGMPAERISQEVMQLVPKVQASFLLDTLEFMHAGGRCSSITRLGANVLHIKPCIQVHTDDHGSMGVGKMYRGKLIRCLKRYVQDVLAKPEGIDTSRVFITHSGIDQAIIDMVRQTIEQLVNFKETYITRAGCTISSHCGPNTLGVLFLQK